MITAYPLQWPQGWPRTRNAFITKSRFDGKPNKVQIELLAEIDRLSGCNVIISTNIPLRQDGLPYVGRRAPDDNGVAVYFNRDGKAMCFACDRYFLIWENMRAIQKTIEALRGIERWGASDMMERAFSGFTALPAPRQTVTRGWPEILECKPGQVMTLAEVDAQYRRLCTTRHPDRGGSHDAMAELNWARQQAHDALVNK